jgi:hypothetical protein
MAELTIEAVAQVVRKILQEEIIPIMATKEDLSILYLAVQDDLAQLKRELEETFEAGLACLATQLRREMAAMEDRLNKNLDRNHRSALRHIVEREPRSPNCAKS